MTYDYRADPILGGLLAYWSGKRRERAMPARRDIDPTEIPRLLPNMQLIDVVDGGARFRYRLIGTELVLAFGRDYTGRFADEVFPPERRRGVEGAGRLVCETRGPVFLRNRYWTTKNTGITANRIYLPLSDNGRDVNILMGGCTFERQTREFAGLWGSATIDPLGYHLESVDPALPAGE